MAAQGSSLLLSQPHQVIGDPAPHLTWAAQGTGPRKANRVNPAWDCRMRAIEHVTSQTSLSFIQRAVQACLTLVFGLA